MPEGPQMYLGQSQSTSLHQVNPVYTAMTFFKPSRYLLTHHLRISPVKSLIVLRHLSLQRSRGSQDIMHHLHMSPACTCRPPQPASYRPGLSQSECPQWSGKKWRRTEIRPNQRQLSLPVCREPFSAVEITSVTAPYCQYSEASFIPIPFF